VAVFAGLNDIDWGAMRHAYGPATGVPALLRALVSDDPAARESALDGMYGAVHHQGDVYDCTVAVIPFLLEAAAAPALPGRGAVVELLASIGGAGWDEAGEVVGEQPGGGRLMFGPAHRAVAAACPLFAELLADPDPVVRRAAPKALLACRGDAQRVVAALQGRLLSETDAAARAAVITAVGTLGRRAAAGQLTGVDPAAIGAWLAGRAAGPADPALRLVAAAELARCAPAMLPPGVVATVVDLLRMVYATGQPPAQAAGFATNTLIGALREISEREAAGRLAPDAAGLVRGVSVAFGDRVEDRVHLLTQLLREPRWEARYDAIRPAQVLIEGWRGSYRELVFLIGEQLMDPRPRLGAAAATALEYLGALAAPAAGALARSLDAAPREARHTRAGGLPAWITIWPRGLPSAGPVLRALAALQDPRALPAVRWALEHPDMPGDIGLLAGQFGPAAADLVPLICRRLQDLPTVDGHDRRRFGLVAALGRIGQAAAAAVPQLLALPPDAAVLTALGRIGPGAADAMPAMRHLLGHGKPAIEIAAAAAVWRVSADLGPVLPVLARHLDSGNGSDMTAAAQALAELGPAAASTAPKLQELLGSTPATAWLRLRAAGALWRSTGEVNITLPVLSAIWSENPHTRVHVAGYLAEMGPAAGTAAPMLRAELERRRRHTARQDGWSSDQVPADLALLRACDLALAAVTR